MTLAAQPVAPQSTARVLGLLVAAIGVVVLAGWGLDGAFLKSTGMDVVSMKANTALGMVLNGAVLALISSMGSVRRVRFFAAATACVVVALGALTLGETFFGWNIGLDQMLVRAPVDAADAANPGRMSPSAAFCLVLTGIALILASWPFRPTALRTLMPTISALSTTAALIGGLALLGHVLRALLDIRFWNYAGMAPLTGAEFVLLGGGLMAWVRSEGALTWTLDAKTTGGFALGIAAILVAAGMSYSFTDRLLQDGQKVAASEEALKEIQQLAASQKDLTVSLGRYLITGDANALAERARIKAAIRDTADRIGKLTADNPLEQSRLAEVARLTNLRIALSDQIIVDVQRQRASAGAASAVRSPLGGEYPRAGQQIDQVLSEMGADEYALLNERLATSQHSSSRTFLLMPIGAYLSVTMLLLGLFSLNGGAMERKRSQSELNESALRFRQLTENIRDVFWLNDPSANKMLYVSPAYDAIWGRKSEDLYAAPLDWSNAIHPEDRERVVKAAENARAPDDYAEEFRIVRPDGSIRWISNRAFPVADEHGNIVRIAGIAEDITERKQIDLTRARLAAIVDSSEDAIIGKDVNGIITDWNAGATKVFGFSADEMVGHSIVGLLPADRLHEEDQILRRIRGGEIVEHLETVRQRKDGRRIDVSITVSPIRDAAQNVVGASKIARDITEQRNLEQQLRQSQKMEAVGQLTGGIAHDFNNLLGVVLGNLDLLEPLIVGNEEAIARVGKAQKAAMRGADLTRRMLAFSSRQSLNPVSTSLEDSIQNVIEIASHALGPDIKITTNFDPLVPRVVVDPAGLENVLLNLAVNARDAMPSGGALVISTHLSDLEASYAPVQAEVLKPGRYAHVTVSDTGHGMSRETLERAFEPFFTTKGRGKGTGMGLAMVYGFAKQSGGTVRIYSELGHGTTISLYLPLAEGVQAPILAAPESRPQAHTGGSVLVVDDEVDLLEIAVAYLEAMGYRVFHATDGHAAVKIFTVEPDIDLVITDVIMPGGINGAELARKVRRLKPGVKIIYSSGFPSDALAERSGTMVDGLLLHKPYHRDEFVNAVRRAMQSDDAVLAQDFAAKT